MSITPQLLRRIRPNLPLDVATKAAAALDRAAVRFDITTARRLAHWLAQLAQESGFRPDARERMEKYTANNLLTLWPGRFSAAQAMMFAGHADLVGNRVYGGRMGNTAPNDGSTYVGRGMVQLTGRANYEKYGRLIGQPLAQKPDLVLEYGVGALVAGAYWGDHGCNRYADRGGVEMVETVTRAVNGGVNGLAARIAYYRTAAAALALADVK